MQTVQTSWSVTTSFTWMPDPSDSLPSCEVIVLAVPIQRGLEPWEASDLIRLMGSTIISTPYEGRVTEGPGALDSYLDDTFTGLGASSNEQELAHLRLDLLDQIRIPEFGSPPHGWDSLKNAALHVTASGAIYTASGPTLAFIALGSTMILARLLGPSLDATSVAIAERWDREVRRLLRLEAGASEPDPPVGAEDTPDEA